MYTQTNEIVLNRMYSGDYLENNLGHEIINMYQADNGNYYVYLNATGSFHLSHAGRVRAMLMIRSTAYKACVEVIGLATGLSDVYDGVHKNQEAYIHQEHITYGGVGLYELFDGNEQKQDCFITFKAERVVRPKKPTYIVFKGGSHYLDNDASLCVVHLEANQAKTSLKQYFAEDEDSADYARLQQLLVLDMSEAMPKVDINTLRKPTEKNFFEVCGIDNNELAFSNIFGHFLEKYPTILQELAAERGVKMDCSRLSVVRECENNIDLFVRTNSHLVVIENKVLSSINGMQGDSQSGLHVSQLKKYYDYGEKIAKEEGYKHTLYILLTPDHNDVNLALYEQGDKYVKVHYSEVRDFLVRYITRYHLQDTYLQELLAAMQKHCNKFYNELFDKTEKRFYQHLRNKQ